MTIEWIATCDLCPWTTSHEVECVAYGQLILHDRLVHLETASGRAIPFVIDTLTAEQKLQAAFMEAFNNVTELKKET